jgi:hypothetical protein
MLRGKVAQVKVVVRGTILLVSLALVMLPLSGCGGASRLSQEETAEGKSASFVRLEPSPTNNSGVGGIATFAKAAAGTRIDLELRGLPEPNEIYLAHVHPGTCEVEEHLDAREGETADHHSNESGHEGDADAHMQDENDEATTHGIEYPLTAVESNAAGEGSSTTVLEGVELDGLLSDGPKYLNVHATGSGEPPQLACTDLGEAI